VQKRIGACHKRLYNVAALLWQIDLRDCITSSESTTRRYISSRLTRINVASSFANIQVNSELIRFAQGGERRGIGLGRYVIMPGHLHLFVRGNLDFSLKQWVRMLKRVLSKGISSKPPHWQQGFFDHLIRHSESYAEKWEYVRQNPVRAGFVKHPDEWPWQGEIIRLAP
jgi:putative transposase